MTAQPGTTSIVRLGGETARSPRATENDQRDVARV